MAVRCPTCGDLFFSLDGPPVAGQCFPCTMHRAQMAGPRNGLPPGCKPWDWVPPPGFQPESVDCPSIDNLDSFPVSAEATSAAAMWTARLEAAKKGVI